MSDRKIGKRGSIAVLVGCQVAALALWFSATAAVPELKAEFGLGDARASLFTSSVQAGFVIGTIISALFTLADRLDPRRLFMISALIAALTNGLIVVVSVESDWVLVLRFVTGACMAGVYPVGMKIAASWATRDMGLLVGLLVGALTLVSASPNLLGALGGADWRITLLGASALAVAAGLTITRAGLGPNLAAAPPIHPGLMLEAWRNKALRLANAGYLGHMWELYAMWAWIGLFLDASFHATMPGDTAGTWAKLATFATLGAGAVGSVVAGWAADRVGRTTITMAAMAVSGSCALVAGFLFDASPVLVVALCLVWGFSIVADSAQFSASVAELAKPALVGTMLTVQTSAGFLLTLLSIHLIPPLLAIGGWPLAFAALAPGPFLGVWAMARLRAHPDSTRLANGRR